MNNSENWLTTRFVVVDVEGNGRQPPEIVELAAVAIEPGGIVGSPREWLVRPTQTISHIVSRLHGITNEMVADAPRFEQIADAVREALGDDYLVAHNARIELDVLSPKLTAWRPRGVVDTLKLARQFMPGRKSYALATLSDELGLSDIDSREPRRAHRAAHDVLATARLFIHLATDDFGAARPLSVLLGKGPQTQSDTPAQGGLF